MIGQTISHYRILDKLGEGGMGVVYKAQDTKLGRTVALKFLAPHLVRDPEARKRFEREARAAASLDHPNICTVFEVDGADDKTFIALTYLEGRPLSKKIGEGPLKLAEALSVAMQLCEGLGAAQAKGIVHRDLKPDNVMLLDGSRGLVKILDFGLAQLAGTSKLTRGGTTLGTMHYMAPEQAEGGQVDHRADIWALGVMLYEMVAGRPPFKGDFDQAVVYSILNESPEPLTAVRTGVPQQLERIVNKCLAKKADQRYQHAEDLLVDLTALRSQLDEGAQAPARSAAARRPRPWLLGGAAVAAIAALGLWMLQTGASEEPAPPEYRLTQITRDPGYTGQPALSPDGRLLAYSSDRSGDGNLDIWVQQLGGGGTPIRLTTDPSEDGQPSFSPDSSQIAFRSGRDGGGIYIVPALGGSLPRRLADGGEPPEFSPDGTLVSYAQRTKDQENHIFIKPWVVPISGGAARPVETNLALAKPWTWSPDGRYLLSVGSIAPGDFGRSSELDWWLVPLAGGEAVSLGLRDRFTSMDLTVGRFVFPIPRAWTVEGNWIIFDARTPGGTRNLWRLRISDTEKRLAGEPQKLTTGTGEQNASVARDGRIAFMNEVFNLDIWSLPIDANQAAVKGDPERIVSGLSGDDYPSISTDGRKLIYTSNRAGNQDVWLRDLETNTDTQVTVGSADEFRGIISPDDAKVVFRRQELGRANLYLVEVGRGSERLLLEDVGAPMSFTPDGKKILFYTSAPIRWKTFDLATGEQQDLGLEHEGDPVHSVQFSPDQQWVSFKLQNDEEPIFVSRVVAGVAQSQAQWIQIAGATLGSGHNWWSPDGNTLYFLSRRDDFQCIWAQSLDPETKQPQGEVKAVVHLHGRLRYDGAGGPFGYGLTHDKHYLPLAEATANIWLAEPQEVP